MIDKSTIITHNHPQSSISESFRVLRTNLQYSSVDKPLKTIVVTSTKPMEGKTTTIVNLAVIFAQMGSKVLLIDTDLRKPKISRIFWQFSKPGLTNYLAAHDNSKAYIHETEVPNLYVMTSGTIPPNPTELLTSHSMKQLIQALTEEYDLILMDSPPLGSVIDASIISTYVDGVILVASSGQVEIEALKRTKEQLLKVGANIIGVVLNNMDKKAVGNSYYYQSYYSEDTEDGNKKKKRRKTKNVVVKTDKPA